MLKIKGEERDNIVLLGIDGVGIGVVRDDDNVAEATFSFPFKIRFAVNLNAISTTKYPYKKCMQC